MDQHSNRTPLFTRHKDLGAKMVSFAGFEMPIEYQGIINEHQAVRTKMGLFDVSHMGEIEVRGKRAADFCQRISTNDVTNLKPGKVQYAAICNEDGGMLDDCTLYRLGEEHFLYVVNAASRERVAKWFLSHQIDGAKVEDRSEDYALLALQGRLAESFLSQIIKRDLATVLYYEFIWAEILDSAVLISRTGYTGEDGFELYLPSNKAGDIWDLLMKEGQKEGLTPIGLGARDTLRLEMGYLLYGSDINEKTTPLEAGVGWAVKMDKGFFYGRDRLMKQKEEGLKRRIRALLMKERGIPRTHYKVELEGKEVGEVTSGTFSPSLNIGIALAYLPFGIKKDHQVSVCIRKKKPAAVVVKPPFVPGSVKR